MMLFFNAVASVILIAVAAYFAFSDLDKIYSTKEIAEQPLADKVCQLIILALIVIGLIALFINAM